MGDVSVPATTCAICCDDMAAGADTARPSVCGHRFCRGCLEQLCSQGPDHRRCPLDRKPFDRICVRHADASETALDAETLQPLRKLFENPAVPAGLAALLLAVLWASPSWLLVLHIAAVGVIYWYTEGIPDWNLYSTYSVAFYAFLVPARLIGITITVYTCVCCTLLVYWCGQLPELSSNVLTPEKALLYGTGFLMAVVLPLMTFSVYSVMQAYCFLLCFGLFCYLQTRLYAVHGHKFACWSLLISCLLIAPALSFLSEITLIHMVCICLVGLWFVHRFDSEANNQFTVLAFALNVLVSKSVCTLAAAVLLGFPISGALYSIAFITYAGSILMIQPFAVRLRQRVPLLVAVNVAMMGLLLPWQLFGLLSYLGCFTVVFISSFLTEQLFLRVNSRPDRQLVDFLLQLAILGILGPVILL